MVWEYLTHLKLSRSCLWTRDVNLQTKNGSGSHGQLPAFVSDSSCLVWLLPGLGELCLWLCPRWQCRDFSSCWHGVRACFPQTSSAAGPALTQLKTSQWHQKGTKTSQRPSLNLPPWQALLPEDRNLKGGIQEMHRTCRPWQDQELSLEEPKFLHIPEAS